MLQIKRKNWQFSGGEDGETIQRGVEVRTEMRESKDSKAIHEVTALQKPTFYYNIQRGWCEWIFCGDQKGADIYEDEDFNPAEVASTDNIIEL